MVTKLQQVMPAIVATGVIAQLAAPAFAQSYQGYGSGNNYSYNPPPQSQNYNSAQSPNCPPPSQQGHVSYVPAGLAFPVSLSTSISTDVARPGDNITANLTQPIQLGDSAIPPGSQVIGEVASAKAGGFLGRAGMLTVKFNRLRLPNGQEVPMSAHIVGGIGKYTQVANGSDTVAGETWKNKVGQGLLRGAVGAGAGAALGTAVGAIAAHGHGYTGLGAGRGAWSGAAIGGGVGVADSLLLRKGKNVTIASGTPMQLQLDAPMSISQSVQFGQF